MKYLWRFCFSAFAFLRTCSKSWFFDRKPRLFELGTGHCRLDAHIVLFWGAISSGKLAFVDSFLFHVSFSCGQFSLWGFHLSQVSSRFCESCVGIVGNCLRLLIPILPFQGCYSSLIGNCRVAFLVWIRDSFEELRSFCTISKIMIGS